MCLKWSKPGKFIPLGAGLHLGFELELLHADGPDDCIAAFQPPDDDDALIGPDYLVAVVEDGSVYGAEFLSAPATLEEHRQRLPELLRFLTGYSEFEAPKSGSAQIEDTGFHVHVSREVLGEENPWQALETLVTLLIYGGPAWQDYQLKLAGRSGNDWAARRTGNQFRPREDVLFSQRRQFSPLWIHEARYAKELRLNLRHDHTLEFRQAASSDNPDTLLRWMTFCEAVCRFARVYEGRDDVVDAEELQVFLDWAREHGYTLPPR